MKNETKVFLPSWVRWLLIPVLVLVWGLITYEAFVTPDSGEEISIIAWALVTIILVMVGIASWLMASGRLPAYIIRRDDD